MLNGVILDDWIAGYKCGYGQSVPNPVAKKCDIGFYCTKGWTSVSLWPSGRFISVTGRKQIRDWTPCLAGYYCPAGITTAQEWPKGYYWPFLITDYRSYKWPFGTFMDV